MFYKNVEKAGLHMELVLVSERQQGRGDGRGIGYCILGRWDREMGRKFYPFFRFGGRVCPPNISPIYVAARKAVVGLAYGKSFETR